MDSSPKSGVPTLPGSLIASLAPIRLLGLLATYLGLWLLLTPYAGLSHDAQAYAFQAVARLDPTTLGQDVFLRFGSQDRFTIFPTIYGAFIEAFGLEQSAAGLTFVLHVLWFGMSFLLAQRMLGTPLALFSLGLLIAIPGMYGGLRVFHIAEPFLTARLPAEVLVLLALWTFLGQQRLLAAVFLTVGLVIHPLMVFPAILLSAFVWIDGVLRYRSAVPVASLAVVIGAVVGSFVIGGRTPTIDPEWVAAARTRSSFLFPGTWRPADWNHTLVTLFSLALAAHALPPGTARTFARAALWLGVAGLALALVSGEIFNLKLLLQGQPWRWLWLSRWAAIALLPALVLATWAGGRTGRATAMLLVGAWIVVVPVSARSPGLLMMGSLLALLAFSAWSARATLPESTQLLLQRASALVLCLILGATVVTALLVASFIQADSDLSPFMQRLQGVANLTSPVVAIVGAAWLCWHWIGRPMLIVIVWLVGVALIAVATGPAIERWTARPYGERNFAKFADWRARIPENTEVFWWDGLREVWFLLQRRSYLTISQGGGVVFSGETSRELRRRAANVSAFIDPGFWLREQDALLARPHPFTPDVVSQICRDPMLGFVVSRTDVGTGAPRVEWPRPGDFVYLYDCLDFRQTRTP